MTLSKYFSFFLITFSLLTFSVNAQDDKGSGIIDDSLRDMSIVLGAGTMGAVLGLSTLSFVDRPSQHWKNLAVGGAIGIVIGVGFVVFNQATRSTLSDGSKLTPMDSEKFASLSKNEFQQELSFKAYLKNPSFNYTFTF